MQCSYLAELALGRRNPSVWTLVEVANAFGIALSSFLRAVGKNAGRDNERTARLPSSALWG